MKKLKLNKGRLALSKSSIVPLNPRYSIRIKGGDTVQQGDTLLAPPDTLVNPPDTLINPGDKPVAPPDTMVIPPDTFPPVRDTFVAGH
ncbi:MAG TPA: hypothetical protein VFS31_08485 [Chitinophagaceae bacterium]|nr:hypothetical protein [Chitinophagaceae bacterium]